MPHPRPKKRKTSTDDGPEETPAAAPTRKQPKKTAHNMIEKRYRTNLNDKIAALRDSVPSLRIMAGTSKMGEDDEEEDLEGLAPAHKLNKATVLAKATEYIRHLEKRNKRLQDENDQLKNRLNAFEKLATMGGGMSLQHQGQHQGHPGQRGPPQGGPGGGMMSRLMVGSLAGLMVVNGLQERSSETKELFSVPVLFLEKFGIAGPSPAHSQMFWLIFKLVLGITAILYVLTPGLFDKKRSTSLKAGATQDRDVSAAPSLASPLKDRSNAWLTAIQTVWVPRHSVGLELAALGIKFGKLSVRRLIGFERYCRLTGTTEEHEQARVKAWTVALDAQLAGGDTEINPSRLLLTLLASWTLPGTPARHMLNALHVRVLFHDLGHFQSLAERLARHFWLEARKPSSEPLPDHLAALVKQDPDVVFSTPIIQKAYNLAYNVTSTSSVDEGFDTVVKDASIRSPLDALAAWFSSLNLQSAFIKALKSKPKPVAFAAALKTALDTAPPASAAHLRALVASATLQEDDADKHLYDAWKFFEDDTVSNIAVTTTTDIRVALRCGMALALMKKGNVSEATRLFSDLDWRRQGTVASSMGMLGFVAVWTTLTTFVQQQDWVSQAGESVDCAAAMLRIWMGDRKIQKPGVARADCRRVIDVCNELQRKVAGMEPSCASGAVKDDGYVSGEASI